MNYDIENLLLVSNYETARRRLDNLDDATIVGPGSRFVPANFGFEEDDPTWDRGDPEHDLTVMTVREQLIEDLLIAYRHRMPPYGTHYGWAWSMVEQFVCASVIFNTEDYDDDELDEAKYNTPIRRLTLLEVCSPGINATVPRRPAYRPARTVTGTAGPGGYTADEYLEAFGPSDEPPVTVNDVTSLTGLTVTDQQRMTDWFRTHLAVTPPTSGTSPVTTWTTSSSTAWPSYVTNITPPPDIVGDVQMAVRSINELRRRVDSGEIIGHGMRLDNDVIPPESIPDDEFVYEDQEAPM